jgi:hypothetical protein
LTTVLHHCITFHHGLFCCTRSRLLNLVTHRLLKKEPVPLHLAFLRCDQLLTEIEDDLCDYEEDIGQEDLGQGLGIGSGRLRSGFRV